MNCFPQLGYSHTWGRMPLWMRSMRCQRREILVLRSELLTVTRKVTASRETLAASGAGECLWWTILVGRTAASMLGLLVGHLLLSVRMVLGVWDVAVVVEHLHGCLLHGGGRGIAHAVHVLGRNWGVRGQRLLGLLRGIAGRVGRVRRDATLRAVLRLDVAVEVGGLSAKVLLLVLHGVLHAEEGSCSCVLG